jgi:acetyl-CoA acetyltransferase family protein
MREAVIVSTARTGIGRAYKGALNHTKSPSMLGHVIAHAVQRAGIEGAELDDGVFGTVLAAGTAGMNVARNAILAAGLPVSVAAQTMDRQCASGLMAIATAAKQIMVDGMDIVVAGGQENVSAVQKGYFDWVSSEQDPQVVARVTHAYMPMLKTAEFVASKYGISREAQDRYALESQRRIALAQEQGRLRAEIVPFETTMVVADKATGKISYRKVALEHDEGNRPDTTLEGLAALNPVIDSGSVTAGNASQLSDGVGLHPHGGDYGAAARAAGARHLPRHGRSWLRSGRNGHRARVCDSKPAEAARPAGGQHWPLGTE